MMLERINAVRAARGLPALRPNARLVEAAKRHAADLAAHVELTAGDSHTGSDGSTIFERQQRAGYDPDWWGEITGWGFGGNDAQMLAWWMASPAHAATILKPEFEDAGVYELVAPGSLWGHYWVVEFGQGGADAPPEPEPARPYVSHVPVVVKPSNSTGLDLLAYLRGDGRAYMVQHPGGAQEKFRTVHLPAHQFLQLKNSQWEQFWYTDDAIWRGVDTSPGDGQYYRQFEDAAQGARWCPRRMTVGQSWRAPVPHTVQTYDKATCRPVAHHRNGTATNALTLAAHHRQMTWNDITVMDVIELVTHTGEHMYFGRNFGLIAWESTWGSSAIAHVLPPHEADNQPEQGCYGP